MYQEIYHLSLGKDSSPSRDLEMMCTPSFHIPFIIVLGRSYGIGLQWSIWRTGTMELPLFFEACCQMPTKSPWARASWLWGFTVTSDTCESWTLLLFELLLPLSCRKTFTKGEKLSQPKELVLSVDPQRSLWDFRKGCTAEECLCARNIIVLDQTYEFLGWSISNNFISGLWPPPPDVWLSSACLLVPWSGKQFNKMDHRYHREHCGGAWFGCLLTWFFQALCVAAESLSWAGLLMRHVPGLPFARPTLFHCHQVLLLPPMLGLKGVTSRWAELTGCPFGLS